MALEDLRELLDEPTLTLPIGGKKFTVRPCTADVWLRLQTIGAAAMAANPSDDLSSIDDISELDLFRLTLGPVYDEMTSHVTGPELRAAGLTAFYWQLGQESIAEVVWRLGGKVPAAIAPPKVTTNTGEGSTTPPRASTSGTSTRKTPKAKAAAKSSRGRSSSTSGT